MAGLSHDIVRSKRYHAYARECLQVAEEAESAEVQASLSELSHIWMKAALKETEPLSQGPADWSAQPRDLPCRLELPRKPAASGHLSRDERIRGWRKLPVPFTQIERPRVENLGGVSPTRAEPRIGVKTTSELLEGIT
jgi:hypothetical protein